MAHSTIQAKVLSKSTSKVFPDPSATWVAVVTAWAVDEA